MGYLVQTILGDLFKFENRLETLSAINIVYMISVGGGGGGNVGVIPFKILDEFIF